MCEIKSTDKFNDIQTQCYLWIFDLNKTLLCIFKYLFKLLISN